MYFCRYWNSRITGMAAITEPAAKTPHGAVFGSAAHVYMPTARVNCASSCRTTFAITKSPSEEMKLSRPTTARTGRTSGMMIVQKVWACVAPSIMAASSSERGIELKNP